MMKSLSKERVVLKIQEDIQEATKDLLFKPVTQRLVNNIRYQIRQIFLSVTNETGTDIQEHIGFEVLSSDVDMNKMEIKIYPRTELGLELLRRVEEEYGNNTGEQ